jgi:hypothetical protein
VRPWHTGLQNGEILKGECPCCETGIKQFFGGAEPKDTFSYKCAVCGTQCDLNRKVGQCRLTLSNPR